jgi:DNA uptake protein ComE-like DNA-binding protein
LQKIADAQITQLTEIKGLGEVKAEKIIEKAKNLLKNS